MVISAAMSRSIKLDRADSVFCTEVVRLFEANCNRFCDAPIPARAVFRVLIAAVRACDAVLALVASAPVRPVPARLRELMLTEPTETLTSSTPLVVPVPNLNEKLVVLEVLA